MMIKKISRIFSAAVFLLPLIFPNAQSLPTNFKLGSESLRKISDATPASNSVEKIIYADNTVWVATGMGISKSTDNGNSWTNYKGKEPFGDKAVSTIAYKDGVIWGALWHSVNVSGSIDGAGDGLVYSTDQGSTWNHVPQPVDAKADTVIKYGDNVLKADTVRVTGQNFTYGIALTKNTVWIVSRAGGFRKSTDLGQTWQRVVLPPDNLDSIKPTDNLNFELKAKRGNSGNNNHIPVSIYAVDDDTIYVGTAGGINKSTDGGISWRKFNHTNQTNPISGNHIWKIGYNKFDKSIWAATWRADDIAEYMALSRTTDGGNYWEILMPEVQAFDVDFRYYGTNNNLTGADVLSATTEGLFRSNNNGTTWLAAPLIVDHNSKRTVDTKMFRAVTSNSKNSVDADIWIGASSNGIIKFEDNGGYWNGNWTVYLNSGDPVPVSKTFAFPNPFSPDNEVVRIKYNIQNSSNVTIRIFDFGMNLVRTLIQNASRGANDNQIEIWDGKDESGKIVPNGVYFYRVDVGSQEPMFGKIMVLM